jgi:hypothetical protein
VSKKAFAFLINSLRFSLRSSRPVQVDETGIAWESDRKQKFGGYKSKNFNNIPRLRGGGAIGSSTAAGGFGGGGGSEGKTEVDDDEHFIVWM